MSISASRRAFLRGKGGTPPPPPLRPPWALAEDAFIDACSRCDDCIKACPERIIVAGDGGFPEIDFHLGACTFCGKCAEACAPGALARQDGAPPWSLTVRIVEDKCLSIQGIECRICGDHCDARAIVFRPGLRSLAKLDIDQGACTGCGACFAPCPVVAIKIAPTPPAPSQP